MIDLDVERHADWMTKRGQNATLTVGPFTFWVGTADGLSFGFGIGLWRWAVSWTVEQR